MGSYEVVLGVDSSELRARVQAEAVADLPVASDHVDVTIVHVFSEPHDLEARQIGGVREAATYLEEADIVTATTTRVGDPATEVIQLANELDANMICVGEWDRSLLDEALHGSVTRDIVQQSLRPVLICRVTPGEG